MAEQKDEAVKPFDIVVNKWNKQTKRMDGKNPYRLWVVRNVEYFERPVGSGNLYSKDGKPAGRLTNIKNVEIDREAAHIEWSAPKTEEDMKEIKYAELQKRITEYEAELTSIKKEQAGRKAEDTAAKNVAVHRKPDGLK
jgi:hypothetical protein